jgi:hypothetical protein
VLTVALDVLELLHTPPVVASVSVIAALSQTADGPRIVPALGDETTVIGKVATDMPHVAEVTV